MLSDLIITRHAYDRYTENHPQLAKLPHLEVEKTIREHVRGCRETTETELTWIVRSRYRNMLAIRHGKHLIDDHNFVFVVEDNAIVTCYYAQYLRFITENRVSYKEELENQIRHILYEAWQDKDCWIWGVWNLWVAGFEIAIDDVSRSLVKEENLTGRTVIKFSRPKRNSHTFFSDGHFQVITIKKDGYSWRFSDFGMASENQYGQCVQQLVN